MSQDLAPPLSQEYPAECKEHLYNCSICGQAPPTPRRLDPCVKKAKQERHGYIRYDKTENKTSWLVVGLGSTGVLATGFLLGMLFTLKQVAATRK